MAKYWAIHLMSILLRILGVMIFVLPIIWTFGLAIMTADPFQPVYIPSRANPFPPLPLPPSPSSAPEISDSAARVINYMATTISLTFTIGAIAGWILTALGCYMSGQMLLLWMEVADNTRALKTRRSASQPTPAQRERFSPAPWMERFNP